MGKEKGIKETKFLVYAGPSLNTPEKGVILTFGKTYTKIPNLPEELRFLKEFFVPLEEYTKLKREMMQKHRETTERVKEVLK